VRSVGYALPNSGSDRGDLPELLRHTGRIKLEQEQRAALRLIELTDLSRSPLKPEEAPQETVVGRSRPPHISRTPPTVRAESVETAVVANPKCRVGLDRIATKPAELRPTVENPRVVGDERGDGRPSRARFLGEGLRQQVTNGRLERRNDGRGQTSRQANRLGRGVAHRPILADRDRASPRRGPDTDAADTTISPPRVTAMFAIGALTALDLDQARALGTAAPIGLLVIAAIVVLAVRAVVKKIVLGLLLAVIALAAWTQRTALDDCVEQVREAVGSSDAVAECGFFGQQIDVPVTLAP